MRRSLGTTIGMAVALGVVGMVHAQTIQQVPAPPLATGVSDPPPDIASPPADAPAPRPSSQLAEQPSGLTTQDCLQKPTAVEKTDCLNQVSEEGRYMPTPAPAPGTQMPMEYRLPLGKRTRGPSP